jgi:hypothetical protein
MTIAEGFSDHIPLMILWEVSSKLLLFSDDEAAHLFDCDR